jgi:hypothetical protein
LGARALLVDSECAISWPQYTQGVIARRIPRTALDPCDGVRSAETGFERRCDATAHELVSLDQDVAMRKCRHHDRDEKLQLGALTVTNY